MKKKNLRKIGLKKSKISNLHTLAVHGGSSYVFDDRLDPPGGGGGGYHTRHPCIANGDLGRPTLHCQSHTCTLEC